MGSTDLERGVIGGEEEKPQAGEPITIKLRKPIQFGKSELITELTLSFSSKALRGFTVVTSPEGLMHFDKHALLTLGCRLAGRPPALADMFTSAADVREVADAALSFLS